MYYREQYGETCLSMKRIEREDIESSDIYGLNSKLDEAEIELRPERTTFFTPRTNSSTEIVHNNFSDSPFTLPPLRACPFLSALLKRLKDDVDEKEQPKATENVKTKAYEKETSNKNDFILTLISMICVHLSDASEIVDVMSVSTYYFNYQNFFIFSNFFSIYWTILFILYINFKNEEQSY